MNFSTPANAPAVRRCEGTCADDSRSSRACGEFLQFTVGKIPLCNALQQGIVPTTEQICCIVGGTPSWKLLWGG